MVENVQRIDTWERLKFDAAELTKQLARRSFQFAFSTLLAVGSRDRSSLASLSFSAVPRYLWQRPALRRRCFSWPQFSLRVRAAA